MTKLIMLGTGHGATINLYNTCFVIQNESGSFLIDTGGSIEIIKRLEEANIELTDIKNIFISHSHTDHMLGLIWMFKRMATMIMQGNIIEPIHIFCNDVVYEAIKGVASYVLSPKLLKYVYSIFSFVVLNNGDKHSILDIDYEFFDILAKGTKQYGFECNLDGNRFVFLGDETIKPALYERVKDATYVTHEAFCLEEEEELFHAYEKNHSTALSVAKIMDSLNVQNLLLYHTEDTHANKKELYRKEAMNVFHGNVFVPDDMEELLLIRK